MLLGLKAEAEKGAAPELEAQRVIGDAPARTSDFGPLALAPGRVKVRMAASGHTRMAACLDAHGCPRPVPAACPPRLLRSCPEAWPAS